MKRKKLLYAQYLLYFAFYSFLFRNVDLEINGYRVPTLLFSPICVLAIFGLNVLLWILLNPNNTTNHSKAKPRS
jgi:hypothetical protein